jgi:hypothetical protein
VLIAAASTGSLHVGSPPISLAEFPSAVNAVQCAVEVKQALRDAAEGAPAELRVVSHRHQCRRHYQDADFDTRTARR